MDRARRRGAGWEDVFIFLFFFVNRFLKLYSFLPSSLLNARLHFHVIHPHLIIQHRFRSHLVSFHFFFFKKIAL